jgi:hypothetical protein
VEAQGVIHFEEVWYKYLSKNLQKRCMWEGYQRPPGWAIICVGKRQLIRRPLWPCGGGGGTMPKDERLGTGLSQRASTTKRHLGLHQWIPTSSHTSCRLVLLLCIHLQTVWRDDQAMKPNAQMHEVS